MIELEHAAKSLAAFDLCVLLSDPLGMQCQGPDRHVSVPVTGDHIFDLSNLVASEAPRC